MLQDVYFGLAIAAMALALCVGVVSVLEPRPPRFWSRATSPLILVVVAAIALATWRWPAILFNQQVNPDESMFIALARLASVRHVPWRDFDPSTNGPFNVWPIAVAHVFGLPFTYSTTRLLAALLALIAIYALYRLVALLSGETGARISALAAVCLFATSSYQADFVQYSSELIPVCLTAFMALAIAKLARFRTRAPLLYFGVAGALAGAILLAKLQAAPIDAALMVIAVALIAANPSSGASKLLELCIFGLCGLLVVAAVLVPVAASGGWNDFLTGNLLVPLWYVHLTSAPPPLRRGLINLIGYPSFLFLAVFSVTLTVIAFASAMAHRQQRRQSLKPLGNPLLVCGSVCFVLLAATYSVVVANEPWGGHLLFTVLPLCALPGCAYGALAVGVGSSGAFVRAITASLLTALVVLSVSFAVVLGNGFLQGRPGELNPAGTPSGSTLMRRVPAGALLALWGWNPEVYVLTGATPGTRDTFTQFQMWPSPYQAYYLKRYIGDLDRIQPEYFLDAAKPLKSAAWTIPSTYELVHFPLVEGYVSRHYVLIGQAKGLRLYRLIGTVGRDARTVKAQKSNSTPPYRAAAADVKSE